MIHPEEPLEFEYVPLGLLIAYVPIMLALISSMKSKFVAIESFVLFVPTELQIIGEDIKFM